VAPSGVINPHMMNLRGLGKPGGRSSKKLQSPIPCCGKTARKPKAQGPSKREKKTGNIRGHGSQAGKVWYEKNGWKEITAKSVCTGKTRPYWSRERNRRNSVARALAKTRGFPRWVARCCRNPWPPPRTSKPKAEGQEAFRSLAAASPANQSSRLVGG